MAETKKIEVTSVTPTQKSLKTVPTTTYYQRHLANFLFAGIPIGIALATFGLQYGLSPDTFLLGIGADWGLYGVYRLMKWKTTKK